MAAAVAVPDVQSSAAEVLERKPYVFRFEGNSEQLVYALGEVFDRAVPKSKSEVAYMSTNGVRYDLVAGFATEGDKEGFVKECERVAEGRKLTFAEVKPA